MFASDFLTELIENELFAFLVFFFFFILNIVLLLISGQDSFKSAIYM